MRNRVWTAFLIGATLSAPLPAMAADETALCGREGAARLHPIIPTHRMGIYPTVSQLRGEEGKTELEVTVDKDGDATDVTVLKSSGSKNLDDTAVTAIRKWHWEPIPPECKDAGIITRVNHDWHLGPPHIMIFLDDPRYPKAAHDAKQPGFGTIVVKVSETGTVIESQIAKSTGSPELDAGMTQIAAGMKYVIPQKDGKPQIAIYVLPIDFSPYPMRTLPAGMDRPVPPR